MINHFSLILWLPVPGGESTYGSSIFVNINLEHKDGQTGEPERASSYKIQSYTWDWGMGLE